MTRVGAISIAVAAAVHAVVLFVMPARVWQPAAGVRQPEATYLEVSLAAPPPVIEVQPPPSPASDAARTVSPPEPLRLPAPLAEPPPPMAKAEVVQDRPAAPLVPQRAPQSEPAPLSPQPANERFRHPSC